MDDRFFFSSEREEADLSNFERIFRASTSFPRKFLDDTISSSSFIQTEEGEGIFEKVYGCSSIIIPNVSILLRSRM